MDKVERYFLEEFKSKLPVNYFLLRRVDIFRTSRRIDESEIHGSKLYKVGFVIKPIAILTENG